MPAPSKRLSGVAGALHGIMALPTSVASKNMKLALAALLSKADFPTARNAYPSMPTLERLTGLSEKRCRIALHDAERLGIITTDSTTAAGGDPRQGPRRHFNLDVITRLAAGGPVVKTSTGKTATGGQNVRATGGQNVRAYKEYQKPVPETVEEGASSLVTAEQNGNKGTAVKPTNNAADHLLQIFSARWTKETGRQYKITPKNRRESVDLIAHQPNAADRINRYFERADTYTRDVNFPFHLFCTQHEKYIDADEERDRQYKQTQAMVRQIRLEATSHGLTGPEVEEYVTYCRAYGDNLGRWPACKARTLRERLIR